MEKNLKYHILVMKLKKLQKRQGMVIHMIFILGILEITILFMMHVAELTMFFMLQH